MSVIIVHKGQVICELDKNDLLPGAERSSDAALHVMQANVEARKADYERYKVDAEGADVPFLKKDMERAQKMFSERLDRAKRAGRSRKELPDALNRNRNSAKANLGSARAAIAKAQAHLSNSRPPCSHRGRKSA